jgi:TolA-binding protein
MKRILAITVATLWIIAGTVLAQEQKPVEKNEGFMEWLKALQRKIETITAKKSMPLSTGVAGIRGAKDDEKAKLYWKGKKGDEAVTEEELAEFRSAVDLAAKGETAAAVRELDEFITRFPNSPLAQDAKKTLDMVKGGEKEPKPAQ